MWIFSFGHKTYQKLADWISITEKNSQESDLMSLFRITNFSYTKTESELNKHMANDNYGVSRKSLSPKQ